jgi:hypothetical protein
MATIHMTPEQLERALREQAKAFPDVMRKGATAAARRGQSHMVGKTPTDQGQARNSWRVHHGAVPKLENDAPHAGIIEMGARPHKVSAEGIENIAGWARRQLGLGEKAALSFAHALAKKIERVGQAPTYFVRNELKELAGLVPREVMRELRKLLESEVKR